MKLSSGQKEENLTFANLWVNSNYELTKNLLFDLFRTKKVILFANKNSTIESLPFKLEQFVRISYNAWIEDINILDTFPILQYQNCLFLFCAGPFGNILTHHFWTRNPYNQYVDVGSILNPFLGSEGFRRGYFDGKNSGKFCVWD